MTTRYVACFVAVGSLVALGACSDTTEPGGMTGTAGTGGSSAGTGGTPGTAGSASGSAGMTNGGNGMAGGGSGSGGMAGGSGGAAGAGGSGGSGGGTACETKLGKAMKFVEGKKDMMAGDLAADAIMPDGARTLELWAKFSGANSWTAEQSIIELGKPPANDLGNNVFGIDMSGRNGAQGVFGPYTHGVSDNNGTDAPPKFTAAVDVGWLHLAWAYDPTKAAMMRLQFTVNGDPLPTSFNQGAWDATGGKLALANGFVLLGASQNFGNGGWDGIMDEVKIWNVFKPAADIKANMRVIPKKDAPGLVAYYQFNEGTGADAVDSTGKAAHKLAACAAAGGACPSANDQAPTLVDSDIPAPAFTCAP